MGRRVRKRSGEVRSARYEEITSLQREFVSAVIAAGALSSGEEASPARVALLDVGAHEGTFVAELMGQFAARHVAERVKPILWEPQPEFAERLRGLAQQWRGDFVPAAAWLSASQRTMLLSGTRCGGGLTCVNTESASLVATPPPIDDTSHTSERARIATMPRYNLSAPGAVVQTRDFPAYLGANLSGAYGGGRVRPFLKLDIEGGEYELLPALLRSRVLCRLGYILIEWHLSKLPRARRRAGLATMEAIRPVLNQSCSVPPRVVHDLIPENNLQVNLGGQCREYCYSNRYCTRPDCMGCARCHVVPANELRRAVAKYIRTPGRTPMRTPRPRGKKEGRKPRGGD
jgi:hypothetical protein